MIVVYCVLDIELRTNEQVKRKQDSQLTPTNPRDASIGQTRSPNIVLFDMLGMVSY